jgi:hypothetical protein
MVAALKGLTIPFAENGWTSRPKVNTYGVVKADFEADALHGDDIKCATAYEGSVDLFSLVKGGAGWIPLITGTLTEHCDGAWSLNSFQYERETGLFHWEWTFQVEG